MRKDKIIKLISTIDNENSKGDPIEVPIEREVFAGKKSVRQSEFYQAAATGLKPELTFVVWTREYNDEQKLKYDGKEYDIIRTYEPNNEDTELICEGIVNRAV